jgi:hypothetical protein
MKYNIETKRFETNLIDIPDGSKILHIERRLATYQTIGKEDICVEPGGPYVTFMTPVNKEINDV